MSALGAKPEKHTLVLSLTAFDPSGHSGLSLGLPTGVKAQTARWKRGIISPLHE